MYMKGLNEATQAVQTHTVLRHQAVAAGYVRGYFLLSFIAHLHCQKPHIRHLNLRVVTLFLTSLSCNSVFRDY